MSGHQAVLLGESRVVGDESLVWTSAYACSIRILLD